MTIEEIRDRGIKECEFEREPAGEKHQIYENLWSLLQMETG